MSKFAADDDTDGDLTSQGDLASEGSEWLMAGNDTDADGDAEGQGHYQRRRPAMQRHRQQRVLNPRR